MQFAVWSCFEISYRNIFFAQPLDSALAILNLPQKQPRERAPEVRHSYQSFTLRTCNHQDSDSQTYCATDLCLS